MKRFPILFGFLFCLACGYAQNIQLHYDFGGALYDRSLDGRPVLTSTVEMFKADKWGNTYFFVDMDYKSSGVAAAYWEVSRELKFWKAPLLAHIEYNGGTSNRFSYHNCYLGGVTYAWADASFTKGFSVMALYKYIQQLDTPHNFQLTGTWYLHFDKGLFTFSGFADWWREKNNYGRFIFLSEPQFWLNLNRLEKIDDRVKLSVGSEVELSHNFGGRNGFYVIPTLAVKWSFD
ncbi:MAG: DUF5020 family protein [Parabacteroides sp.]|nr:DUF5020 family protein [Parabacteroides sp.]